MIMLCDNKIIELYELSWNMNWLCNELDIVWLWVQTLVAPI